MGRWPTLQHENGLFCPCRALGSVGTGHWYHESAHKLTGELPAPRIVAASTPSKVVTRTLLRAPASLSPRRWRHGPSARAVCRPRCAQEDGDGLCAGTRRQRGPGPACAHLWHHDGGAPDVAGLARGAPCHPRGDGEHRRVLASDLLCPRRDFYLHPGHATQIAQVPGRKTDVNDAAWIAQLLECGL